MTTWINGYLPVPRTHMKGPSAICPSLIIIIIIISMSSLQMLLGLRRHLVLNTPHLVIWWLRYCCWQCHYSQSAFYIPKQQSPVFSTFPTHLSPSIFFSPWPQMTTERNDQQTTLHCLFQCFSFFFFLQINNRVPSTVDCHLHSIWLLSSKNLWTQALYPVTVFKINKQSINTRTMNILVNLT